MLIALVIGFAKFVKKIHLLVTSQSPHPKWTKVKNTPILVLFNLLYIRVPSKYSKAV